MLHITSFMQNIAKLNNKNKQICVNSDPPSVLNGLNRNYSFIYDHNLKRYDYHYENEDDESDDVREGYWGHIRDRNADKRSSPLSDTNQNSYDGYWGLFKDPVCEVTDRKELLQMAKGSYDENGINIPSPCCSKSSSIASLSSSINSLTRFKDVCYDDEETSYSKSKSRFDNYETKLEYDYNYKTSKLKIQACKRDEMKILMQSLEDQESKFKREVIKSFDTSCLSVDTSQTPLSSSLTYSTRIKEINFLHFCNNSNKIQKQAKPTNPPNLNNFKSVFNTLTKLKKTINLFNGDFLNLNRADLFLSFINNVHASVNDVDGFIFNYLFEKNQSDTHSQINLHRQTTNVSLCSNIYETLNTVNENRLLERENWASEKNQKLFGYGNHSTMLFEYQNVKIGFMALVDACIFEQLNTSIKEKLKKDHQEDKDELSNARNSTIEYVDYIAECDKLSKQLRLCGANLIVVLTNMEDASERRLISEGADLDIVFSSSQTSSDDIQKIQLGNRWLIKSGTNFDFVSLVSLKLDELSSNKILDVAITKYFVE